ncbi:hypothetical protein B0H10DRAFT_2056712 [Mycena sp. CBHHK59/15]|nr:hypothetical protein B0H10DRAFT_2056712 [Mycena sp. CBHHK59/15]
MRLTGGLFSIALSILVAAAWNVPAEYGIMPSSDGRFLRDTNGRPFFWQADTAWLLFHRLNYTEAEMYLSDRASKGFTVVLAVGFTQVGITSPNRNGDLPFVGKDVQQPNEPYWAYIDSIVELAWDKGIRICMVPAWGQYVHDSALVADTNPWWENKTAVKADYTAGGVPPTYDVVDWSPVYDALARGIVAGEQDAIANSTTWSPLLTIHPTNQWFSGGPLALASAFLGDRSWLTLDACQSGHTDFPPNPPIPWWNARRGWEPVEQMYAAGARHGARVRPVLDNEPHYEDRYSNGNSAHPWWNASDVRTGSWQAVFSGAAGLTYGANAVMQFAIPGLYASDGTGPGDYWLADLALPGSGQMQWVEKAVRDRGDATYFQRVPGDDKRVTAMRDSAGSWIMVYTPTGEPFAIDTASLVSCDGTQASWFDPLDGTYRMFEFVCRGSNGASVVTFTPPVEDGHVDWTFVLEVKN